VNFIDLASDPLPRTTNFLRLSLNLRDMDNEEVIGLLLFAAVGGALVFVFAALVL
jgi:hypothetical protein